MKKSILLIILFIGFCINLNAQQKTNTALTGDKPFVNSTAENNAIEKSNKEKRGDKFFFRYAFDKAISKYVRVKNLTTDGHRKMAESYRNMGKNAKAEAAYSNLISTQSNPLPEDYYSYASLLKNSGNYNEAFKMMDKFCELKPYDLRTIDYIANKEKFANLSKDDGTFKIKQLDVNSDADDFGPAYYKNNIVFASTKEVPKMIARKYNWTNKPFWDLYISEVENGQLKKAKNFSKKINSKLHDGPASFSNNGTFMAFTRNKINDKSDDNMVELLILFSTYADEKWSEPIPFALNSKEYQVAHPSLSADGNTMYFASNMPGGFGGSDIYRVTRFAGGTWGSAENMGNTINTEGDEMFPFLENDNQILFFTSNGRFGLGGLDIFYCSVNGSETGSVKNAGAPLNTQYDDFSVIINNALTHGYFASNRPDGSGGDDIYGVDILKSLKIDKRIEGIAQDKDGKPISETFVLLLDNQSYVIDSVTTKNDGAFSFFVDSDNYFKLIGKKEEYLEGQIITNTLGKEIIVKADITLLKEEIVVVLKEEIVPVIIKEKVKVKIENLNPIYFDLDKSDIRPDAEIELKKIIKIMNDNPDMVVELSSFTDSRATMEYNQILSDNRAKATLKYIKSKISNPERIYGRGYGETRLVNNCASEGDIISNCTEEQHQENRRTEFVIEK